MDHHTNSNWQCALGITDVYVTATENQIGKVSHGCNRMSYMMYVATLFKRLKHMYHNIRAGFNKPSTIRMNKSFQS